VKPRVYFVAVQFLLLGYLENSSRLYFWIPAFAGMTVFKVIDKKQCHSRAGGNPFSVLNYASVYSFSFEDNRIV